MTTIIQLLEEQYVTLEEYANAQSRLLNASMKKSSSDTENVTEISSAIERLEICRQKVQSNLYRLLEDVDNSTKYKEHIDLSRRAIKTIAINPSWCAAGIPSHTEGVLESNTVALACLRGSIARIKDIELSS